MNKKIISLIMTVFLLLISYNISYATETGVIYIESSKSVVKNGEEVEITINIKDAKTAAFNLSLYFDNSKWEYVSKIDNTNIQDDHIIYVWYDTAGGSGAKQGEIAKLRFKAKKDGISTFSALGEFYNLSGQLIKTTFEAEEVQIKKEEKDIHNINDIKIDNIELTNTNLETLAIENTLLYPPFNNIETKYKAEVANDIENLNILAIPQNENAKAEISGRDNLKEGDNTITVTVTAEDGVTKKAYEIIVHKRNVEQENKYEEEQQELQEKLDEAYKIEKTSSDINVESNRKDNTEYNLENGAKTGRTIGIIIGTIIVVGLTVLKNYFKKTTQIK